MELFSELLCETNTLDVLHKKKLVFDLAAKRPAIFVSKDLPKEEFAELLKKLEDNWGKQIKELHKRLHVRANSSFVVENKVKANKIADMLGYYKMLKVTLLSMLTSIKDCKDKEDQLHYYFTKVEDIFGHILNEKLASQLRTKKEAILGDESSREQNLEAYCDILKSDLLSKICKRIEDFTMIYEGYLTKIAYEEEEIVLEEIAHNYIQCLIRFDKNTSPNLLQEYIEVLKTLNILQPCTMMIVEDAQLTDDELKKMQMLEELCQTKQWEEVRIVDPEIKREPLFYSLEEEYKDAWKASVVKLANANIKEVVDYIRQAKLSPLEAATYIHKYVSTVKAYNKGENNSYSTQASFVGAYDEESGFVCAGYTALYLACIKELKMPGLSAENMSVKIYENKRKSLTNLMSKKAKKYYESHHSQLIVHIDDKKYGKKGDYLDDPTWDNTTSEFEEPTFAHCLLPIATLYHYKCGVIQPAKSTNKVMSSACSIEKEKRDQNGKIVQQHFKKDENWEIDEIQQSMMEEIIFTMLQKRYEGVEFEVLENTLARIVKKSYIKASEFWSEKVINLQSPNLQLTRQQLLAIFENNKSGRVCKTDKGFFSPFLSNSSSKQCEKNSTIPEDFSVSF